MKVTDPDLIAKLDAMQNQAAPQETTASSKVTDPDLIAKLDASVSQPANGGFLSNAVDSLSNQANNFIAGQEKRGAEMQDTLAAQHQRKQTAVETLAQLGMQEIGAAGSVAAAPVEALARVGYEALPVNGQDWIKEKMQSLAPYMQKYQQNLDTFNAENPRAGRNFQAIRELANVLPVAKIPNAGEMITDAARIGSSAVRNVAKDTATATKNAVKDTAMYPVEGAVTVAKGMRAKSADAIEEISRELSKNANTHYTAMRTEGAQINPAKTADIFSAIDTKLASRGDLIPELHGKTIAVVEALKNKVEQGALDLGTLDQYRRVLSRIKPGIDHAEDAGMASAAVKAIDSQIDSIGGKDLTKGSLSAVNSLFAGRAESRKYIKIDKINDIIRAADGDPNRIKAGLTRFINKKGNLRGFTGEEKNALIDASRSTTAEKLLKMGGKFGIDLGTSLTPGNTVAPVIGGFAAGGGLPGAAVVAGGTAARQLQKYMARGKIDNVISAIRNGKLPKELTNIPALEARQIIKDIKSGKN